MTNMAYLRSPTKKTSEGRTGDFEGECVGGPLSGMSVHHGRSVYIYKYDTEPGRYIFVERNGRAWWQWFAD